MKILAIYIWFYLTVWLFTWYSSKLLKDVSGRDQYWHRPQMYFLWAIYLYPFIVSWDYTYLIRIVFLGLQFMFLFNVGLNLYRHKDFDYVGEYDFVGFWTILILFLIGFFSSIIYEFTTILNHK